MTSEVLTERAGTLEPTEEVLDAAYVEHLLGLSRTRRLPSLVPDLGDAAACRVDGLGDGLTTLVFRTDQVDSETLRVIMEFRLAEFLGLGMMSARLARRLNLSSEPVADARHSMHAVCLDETGRILGYLALLGASEPVPAGLGDPGRERFPVEHAHHVDLVTRFARTGLTTHDTWEIKRFVRASGLPRGHQRDRVPWHLIAALGLAGRALDDVGLIIGDSREDGALRHLRLIGFDPLVLPDTRPSLPRDYLMWPSYERPVTARPFASLVPPRVDAALSAIVTLLRRDSDDPGWQRTLLRELRALRSGGPATGDGGLPPLPDGAGDDGAGDDAA